MPTTLEKAEAFRALHARDGVFVIPNPWDIGSARLLESLGFECLATTSAGFAVAHGRSDGEMSLDAKIEHCRALAAATNVPIAADLENGFGHSPEEVALCIRRCGEAGVVGGSIEDYRNDPADPFYPFDVAVERIRAAVEAARALPFPFTLTARAEHLLHGGTDLDEVIERLRAYQEAGADVLYAPGLRTVEQVRAVASTVDRPLNVLGTMLPQATVAELGAAGAKRISVGGSLHHHAAAALKRAATALRDEGRLGWS